MTIFDEAPDLEPSRSSSPGQRILLIDEDANDLKYFTMLLEQMDYSVWAFSNYWEAERCLAEGRFDLVILSQGGPGNETLRLVEFSLGHERYTPVVVLAPSLDVNSNLQAMQLGASDYLEKPLTPTEFERVVSVHCQPRRREISAASAGASDA